MFHKDTSIYVPKILHILTFQVWTFKITNGDPGDYKLQNGKNIMLNTTEQMSPKSFKKAKIPWKPNSKNTFVHTLAHGF